MQALTAFRSVPHFSREIEASRLDSSGEIR